jgi:uncharacterized protein YdiU (UPF0061 family)
MNDAPTAPAPASDAAAAADAGFRFDNSFARELPDHGVRWPPARVPAPQLLFLNAALATELGLDPTALAGQAGAELFAGNRLPSGAEPLAQAYAGHQFGGFSPQLGDGRALLIGEVVDRQGRRRDIAFKGSGRTPFSRGGDGKAAVGPMLREVLLAEALHALGVPTTRALAVAATGEAVRRERSLPGAVLTRVAASHLRVGTFEFFAARGDTPRLRQLLDHAIARHDPALAALPAGPERTAAWLQAVLQRQAALVAAWMNLGFIHGVMNTDNMTISGETIDYGPCAFMEVHDPAAVFSSIDHRGRYAWGNQPAIAQWNLARLAEAVLPLLQAGADDDGAVQRARAVIESWPAAYAAARWEGRHGLRARLGLAAGVDDAAARALADDFHALLQAQRADHTAAWRALADAAAGRDAPLRERLADPAAAAPWLARWHARLAQDDAAAGVDVAAAAAARSVQLRATNPRVIARNHRVEQALAAASDEGDLAPFEALLAALRRPFDDDPALAPYAEPAPAEVTAGYRTFCGT